MCWEHGQEEGSGTWSLIFGVPGFMLVRHHVEIPCVCAKSLQSCPTLCNPVAL